MIAPVLILGTGAWIYLWYFLFGPAAAGLWCASLIAFGFLYWTEAREIEIPVPDRYFEDEAA